MKMRRSNKLSLVISKYSLTAMKRQAILLDRSSWMHLTRTRVNFEANNLRLFVFLYPFSFFSFPSIRFKLDLLLVVSFSKFKLKTKMRKETLDLLTDGQSELSS